MVSGAWMQAKGNTMVGATFYNGLYRIYYRARATARLHTSVGMYSVEGVVKWATKNDIAGQKSPKAIT